MNILTDMPVHFINNVDPITKDVIIFCATYLGILVIVFSLMFIFVRKLPFHSTLTKLENIFQRMKEAFIIAITTFGSYIASVIFKNTFMIGRPATYNIDLHPLIDLSGNGFPSSHAAFFSALAVTLFFINKKAGIWAGVGALVIGIARVLAGVHSPLDILGGFLLGILFSSIVDFIVEKLSF